MVENVMHPGVREYLEKQSDEIAGTLHYLRDLILSSDASVQERYRWSLPFFDAGGRMCMYLQVRKGLVEVAFIKGDRLDDPAGMLQHEQQKTMRYVRLSPDEDIPRDELLRLVAQAVGLNHPK